MAEVRHHGCATAWMLFHFRSACFAYIGILLAVSGLVRSILLWTCRTACLELWPTAHNVQIFPRTHAVANTAAQRIVWELMRFRCVTSIQAKRCKLRVPSVAQVFSHSQMHRSQMVVMA